MGRFIKNFFGKSRFWQKYFGEQVNIRMKMTRMIFLMIFLGLIIDLIFNCGPMRQRGMNLYTALLGMASLALAFFLSGRVENVQKMVFIILFPANIMLFPTAFLFGGGAESGEPMWMLMGFVAACLLLDGWWLYIMLIFTVPAIGAAYWISYRHPEIYASLKGLPIMQFNSAIGLITIGVLIAVLFRYQNKIYESQKELAERQRREIEEISDSKALFFANMSHEIRTPINTIIGLNEMILRENVSDEVAENAINIQNASKILLALINDILDLSKMESGKMDIVPTQYETASMFSDLVNVVWVRANQKKLDFKVDIDENIPSMLYGDEVRIKQVLTNILTNSVKYTEKGSVMLTVSGERLGDNLIRMKMAVEDTGIGIKKEDLENLFTVFKRVDQEKTRKIEGTGLGLSISKQLVDMMGGTIKVDSVYQKGTCFTVTIDQQIVDEKPIGSLRYAAKHRAGERETYHQSFEAPDARVLVVDDNEMNLMVARKLLKDTKVQVETAASGRECLEKTKENQYHVILLDYKMQDMDGEETLHVLRNRQEGYCQKTPVIALTANVMANAAQWYQDKGFDGYLAKPVSGALLEAALMKFLPDELIESVGETEQEGAAPEISAMTLHRKKRKIAVCAECVCDLPQDLVEQFEIKLMYYYVTTEEGRFIDTKEIGGIELLEYLASGKSAKATIASQEEYEAFFADRLVEAEQVIFITVADGLNEGYRVATQAAKNFDNVTVINSGHLSSGMGIMVLCAAQLAQQGKSMEEIMQSLEKLRPKVSTSFIVQSVDSMYRNGRIDKKVRNLSRALQLHPVLRIAQGKIIVGGFMMGNSDKAALDYVKKQLRRPRKIDGGILFITHTGLTAKQLEAVKAEASRHKKFERVSIQKASASIASNCGVGTFGLLYIRK